MCLPQSRPNHTTEYREMNTLSVAREVKSMGIDVRSVLESMIDGEQDFEVDGYRFIHPDSIDEIQQGELSSDTYMLGCFNAWFLADILGCPTDAIEKMQASEAFEGIGAWVLDGHLEELQQAYAAADGYGHHFAHYDHEEHEIGQYLAFRVN